MYSSVGQDDSRLGRVLDRELGPAVLPGETPDGTRQVLPPQRLHILDLQMRNDNHDDFVLAKC